MYLDIYKYLLSLHTTVWPDFCFEKWEPAIFGPGFCFKFRMIIDSIIILYSNCIFDQTRVCTMDKTRVKNEKKKFILFTRKYWVEKNLKWHLVWTFPLHFFVDCPCSQDEIAGILRFLYHSLPYFNTYRPGSNNF